MHYPRIYLSGINARVAKKYSGWAVILLIFIAAAFWAGRISPAPAAASYENDASTQSSVAEPVPPATSSKFVQPKLQVAATASAGPPERHRSARKTR